MFIDYSRLEELLADAGRCQQESESYTERQAHAARAEVRARKDGEDVTWLQDMQRDYAIRVQEARVRMADLQHAIREEISRLEKLTGHSVRTQLELVGFLDDHGRDGTSFAQRAVLLQPASPDESLALAGYLESKGKFADAATATREGWLHFGSSILRSKCADMLSMAGATGELIDLLADHLREDPADLALMERLSVLLLEAGRTEEAFAMMGRSLRHPAGAARLLASFMALLDKAGQPGLAVELAGQYLRGNACDKMAVRRELSESLRRTHQLHVAVAFLDAQAGESPADREVAGYIPTYLISSVRSEDRAIRDATLALLHAGATRGSNPSWPPSSGGEGATSCACWCSIRWLTSRGPGLCPFSRRRSITLPGACGRQLSSPSASLGPSSVGRPPRAPPRGPRSLPRVKRTDGCPRGSLMRRLLPARLA